MPRLFNSPQQRFKILASTAVILFFCALMLDVSLLSSDAHFYFSLPGTIESKAERQQRYESATAWALDVQNDPVQVSDFKKLGQRLSAVKEWISYADSSRLPKNEKQRWSSLINTVVSDLVPFIQHPNSQNDTHLDRLRSTYIPGSKGLVIPTGKNRFRFACHLVLNIRHILRSDLPIQIAYAGEDDLPKHYRDFISSIAPRVSTFDVTGLFDDHILGLENSGWAIKAFALLGSTFEQVILLDADDVFLQPPEVIFNDHPGYLERGNLLFHDRLLWQGAFKERHAWWEKELAGHNLSDTIRQSKVYMDGYAEEGDSGVVAIDKSRPDVLLGLLHIAWQNTKDVRSKYTYVQGHGDKESWWFGFELTNTPYSMEEHYASILGHKTSNTKVCSFTIAHVDHRAKLLWFNGSLLKNKEVNSSEFDVAKDWMVDGKWEKGATKQHLSCMVDAPVQYVDNETAAIITNSVERAMVIDLYLNQSIPGLITW